jgi:hypothetical protein
MKTLRVIFVGLLIASTSIFVTSNASAGQISATGATISWDDNALYAPTSCSAFKFDVVMDSSIWQVSLSINNKFGDIVGSSSSQYGNGQISLQVCSDKDLSGTVLIAKVITQKIITTIYEKPITFLSRTSATTVTPVPTVTVTAKPEPAPTVFVTNPADQTLSTLVLTLTGQVNALNAKLKKICSTKPKPKGC